MPEWLKEPLRRVRDRVMDNHAIEDYAYKGAVPAAPLTEVEKLFWGHDGAVVHKWHHYLPIYDRYFTPWKGRPLRMLEIGVSKGGSLSLWRKFFGPEAVIFGIDLDPSCKVYNGQAGQVRIGSQDDPAFLKSVIAEMGGVDIILDDGSHVSKHIRASLDTLYPLLAEGGLYVIEDLHCAYWRSFGGGYRAKAGFMTVVKSMVDDMHHWYHRHGEGIAATAGKLSAIHIHDSLIVLEKNTVSPPVTSHRGKEQSIAGEVL